MDNIIRIPDIEEQPQAVLGMMAQASHDAAQKVLEDICEHYGYEPAYWQFVTEIQLDKLATGFQEVLQSYKLQTGVRK